LTVGAVPTISSQPANVAAVIGTNATFSVTASGSTPLYYQWYKNGTAMQGANLNYITFASVTNTDAGTYQVVITNAFGQLTSSSAILTVSTVGVIPTISSQPPNVAAVIGTNATFSVTASGYTPLYYQWYKNGIAMLGANLTYIAFTSVTNTDAGTYQVVITNSYGQVSSRNATLSVGTMVTITNQPLSLTVTQGQSAIFSVGATGSTPISYQWTKNGADISGATVSTYSIANAVASSAATYAVKVSNLYGSVTSSNALLTVLVPVAITNQPSSLTVTQGQGASFTVGVSGTLPISYQWTQNGTNILAATNSTYTITNTDASSAGTYAVAVSNPYASVTSSNAVLTVICVPIAITQQPTGQQVVLGRGATFSVTAVGNQPLTYQWFKNGLALIDGGNIVGAVSNTLALTTTTTNDSGAYGVSVSNPCGTTNSSVANLLLGSLPQYLSISCIASNCVALQMTGSAGFAYVLEVATNAKTPVVWQSVTTNTTDSNGIWSFNDTNAALYPMRFYRTSIP
jgi:hypothetical protein